MLNLLASRSLGIKLALNLVQNADISDHLGWTFQ
ncbi:hypothetical protein RSAG8_07134, partial [Rhizoctonia solani AG-8 WAC10335]